MDLKKRIYSRDALSAKEGSSVVVAGWVSRIKLLGKLVFIHLRDREGVVQITVKSDSPIFPKLKELTHESVIAVEGEMVKGELKSGAKEILAEEMEIISLAHSQLPMDMTGFIDSNSDTRFDSRYMDLRRPEVQAVFKIRSQVSTSLREFLLKKGFIEVNTPKIVGAGAEGGATLFELLYYGRKAYLNQSQQLYKQMLMSAGFDRIFEIGPSFRAEKSYTRRHQAEFTQLDFEMSFIDSEEDVLKVLEELLIHVLKDVKKNCVEELKALKRELEIPKIPFKRITYEDALKLLAEKGTKLKFGDDIGTAEEKLLNDIIKEKYKTSAFFITKFPYSLKPFYIMTDGKVSRGFDLEFNGEELVSGGQREHRIEVLIKQIEEKGLNPKDFEFYVSSFRHGIPNHGGFGMGIDRLIMMITGVDHIREAVLFPRTPERVIP